MPERRQQNSQAGFKVQLGKGKRKKAIEIQLFAESMSFDALQNAANG
jgi:hypothetical protein